MCINIWKVQWNEETLICIFRTIKTRETWLEGRLGGHDRIDHLFHIVVYFYEVNHESHHCGLNRKHIFPYTYRRRRATLIVCWPLSHSPLHICISQHPVVRLLRFVMWRCACDWSLPSGYVRQRQPLLVAVDTRRHPVNAQRSLEINPVCMSILAKHTNTRTRTTAGIQTRTHSQSHMVDHMMPSTSQTLTPVTWHPQAQPASHWYSVQKKQANLKHQL